jgi:uncharacterized RDD family membrane protein YckC
MMGERYGGFWRRYLAYFIDKLIILFLYLFLIMMESAAAPSSSFAHRPDLPAGFWSGMNSPLLLGHVLVYVFLGMAYFTHFHGAGGQTPGKALLKLQVVRVTGESLTYRIAFVRWIGSVISRIPCYLGFLWVVFDGRKQGWHDKLAGTLVVLKDHDSRD